MKIVLKTVLALTCFLGASAHGEGYTGDTLVRTPNGHVQIKDLKAGDEVFSIYDKAMEGGGCCSKCDAKPKEEPKKCGGNVRVKAKKVVGIAETESSSLIELTIGEDKLVLDSNATVLSVRDRKFVKASELNSGDILANVFLQPILVDKVRHLEGSQKTFVIEVEDNHTFFASKQNILVHNGPFMALLCATACSAIEALGCVFAGAAGGPILVALITATCATMSTGVVASCTAICLALPTP